MPWLLASAWVGRWIGWTPNSASITWGAMLFIGITLMDWLLRP
jgi:hypothetical protein